MNRKRLAISAAVIGAIAYPVWTESFRHWHTHCRFGLEYIARCNEHWKGYDGFDDLMDVLLGGESVLMDVLVGGAIAAAICYWGPELFTAWLRWVREEKPIPKETGDSANRPTPAKKRTKAVNISAFIMGLLFARIFATYFSYLGPGGEIIGAGFGGFLGAGFAFIIAGLMSKRKQLHNGDILPAQKEPAAERADRLTDR